VPLFKAGVDNPQLKRDQHVAQDAQHVLAGGGAGMMIAEPRHPKITDVDLAIEPFTQEAYNGTMSVKMPAIRLKRPSTRCSWHRERDRVSSTPVVAAPQGPRRRDSASSVKT